jgi:hypothetical protein
MDLIWLGLTSYVLNIDQFLNLGMDKNVMAAFNA